jgi:hypothetical protein
LHLASSPADQAPVRLEDKDGHEGVYMSVCMRDDLPLLIGQ